jgi:hypothetical protein
VSGDRRRGEGGGTTAYPGGGGEGDDNVGTVDERLGRLQTGRSERRRGVGGDVETAARSASDNGCQPTLLWRGRGAWQTCIEGALTGGPCFRERETDRWVARVSDFRIKIYSWRKIAQNKYLEIEKNSRKIRGGRKSNLEHFS